MFCAQQLLFQFFPLRCTFDQRGPAAIHHLRLCVWEGELITALVIIF
jgi:hypothetical protein